VVAVSLSTANAEAEPVARTAKTINFFIFYL
jgi:hypothetical protein